ncbi:type III-A CRISPR-associated RAMP protein Csm5 [Desulfolucanica intricata]|uniref:type III-A CRISPR-associated RAMP protein Csm5 n=1 Tax=Desulfolucanica intricata TaxID=1285191 RepID=UPI00082F815B|nr:type III-A CRISPR-associated RAMP protein Csm5 [Desulfolucanica intricata]
MRQDIVLKTKSPIHIGGRIQELGPLEFIIFGGRCYVVDESRLGRGLISQNRLDSLSVEISRQGSRFSLKEFLQHLRLLNEGFLKNCTAYFSSTGINSSPRRIRPFIRDAFSCPFVPGSSIKGVIRTAVLYGSLKKMREESPENFNHCLINVLKGKLQDFYRADEWKKSKPWFKDKTKSSMAEQVERQLMQNFDLPVPGGYNRRGPTGQQRDIMRAVKVSDTQPLDKDTLSLVEVQVLSLTRENEVYLKTPVFVEVIPPETELHFSIVLDENILGDFAKKAGELPFKTLDDVLLLLKDFTADLWEFESHYWNGVSGPGTLEMRDFYRHEPAGMRLGWGSGLSGASLLMLLPEDLRHELRDALFEPREQFDFPKSRRAVMEGDRPQLPLGWVSISKV